MLQTAQSNDWDSYGYPQQPNAQRKLRNLSVASSKRILLTAIYLLLSIIGLALRLGRLGRRYPALTPQTFHPRRILVLRLDLIGDLVLSLTVVRALKHTY